MTGRTDRGSRLIAASPEAVYAAFLDPAAVAQWRPPRGMTAEVFAFDPREGGGYRMAFVYDAETPGVRGKSSERADIFEGRFVELVPGRKIVEAVEFRSADPAFAGTMTITTEFTPAPGGAEVTVACENVPAGVSPEDHAAGIASSLENLARFVE